MAWTCVICVGCVDFKRSYEMADERQLGTKSLREI